MNIRDTFTLWGPTSLAVLLAASLASPAFAQPTEEKADSQAQEISIDAVDSAAQVADQNELPVAISAFLKAVT